MSRFDTINTAQSYATTGLSVAGSIVTAAAHGAALTGSAATVAAIGSAATVVGLVAVPVMILLGKIFHGADPRQVPASQIEQAFELAAFNIMAAGRAGMISRSEALSLIDYLRKKGEEFYRQTPGLGKAGGKGVANLRMVLDAQVADAGRSVPVNRTRALDLAAARKLYIKGPVGKGHWYKESVDAGTRLSDQSLSALQKSLVEKALSAAAPVKSLLTAPVSKSLPVPTWAAALGMGLIGVGLRRFFG